MLDSAQRPRYHPVPLGTTPTFSSGLLATATRVTAQLSNGERWSMSASRGLSEAIAIARLESWAGPPVSFGGDRAAVAVGPGQVEGIDLAANAREWLFDAGGEASLTGEPPRLMALPEGVLVGVRRNHGVECYRLAAQRGQRLWGRKSVLVPAPDFDPRLADVDSANIYLPAAGTLTAVHLNDGPVQWVADLAAEVKAPGVPRVEEWQVRAGRTAVVAYPVRPVPVESPALVFRRTLRSFLARPSALRIPGILPNLYDAWATRTLPILFLEPETGRVVHRLDLPAGPFAAVHLGAERAVVVTGNGIYRLQSP